MIKVLLWGLVLEIRVYGVKRAQRRLVSRLSAFLLVCLRNVSIYIIDNDVNF